MAPPQAKPDRATMNRPSKANGMTHLILVIFKLSLFPARSVKREADVKRDFHISRVAIKSGQAGSSI